MKILITGAGGFIGGYLSRYCSENGCSVLGLDIREPQEGAFVGAFEHCDVRDTERIFTTIARFQPDQIYHLAAQSYPTVSMEKPLDTMVTNACGTINVMEAVRNAQINPVVVVACSSAEYGIVAAENLPVREDHALKPLHPYGVSKVAQDLLTYQYFANYKLRTVRIRIFNTTGPGKMDDVCSDFTKRAIEVELGIRRAPISVGNLRSRRAIIDVRDMVRGLWLAGKHSVHGEVYNVGGTNIHSGADLIEAIRLHVATPVTVREDRALMRTCDEPVIAGDITRFQQCSGWKPEVPLSQTILDMLEWWRTRLGSKTADEADATQVTDLTVPARV
jgi:GDP-4-dehydro-6-deoxy-D-mannose reductase